MQKKWWGNILQLAKKTDWMLAVLVGGGILLAVIVRVLSLNVVSGDSYYFTMPWFRHIHEAANFGVFRENFYNYTPLYLYIFYAVDWVQKLFGVSIYELYLIKSISIIFDILLAGIIGAWVKTYRPERALWAFFIVLFSPSIFINSGFWGQADVIYTTFLVLSVFAIIRGKLFWSGVWLGIAFALKVQALFLAPFFVLLWFLKHIKFRDLMWNTAMGVGIYLLSIVPALLAGRGFEDLITIISQQANYYQNLVMGGLPNIYQWLPNSQYNYFSIIGLVFTAIFFFVLSLLEYTSKRVVSTLTILQTALLSLLASPFFLPKMHERYMFSAEVMSIVLALYAPKYWWVALVINGCSFLGYFPFLFGITVILPSYLAFVVLAVIIYLVFEWYQGINRTRQTKPLHKNRKKTV